MSDDPLLPPSDDAFQATTPVDPEHRISASKGSGDVAGRSLPRFDPGAVVAERYRIVAFLGEGGMGEVYEAEDQVLREQVALKTVKAGLASEQRAIDRFLREIQLARRVTHRNVCRIFDVGFHSVAGHAVAFLTMELLRGETLAAHLGRHGRLAPPAARPLVEQMAQGLAAAHEASVIHRDFKSSNVILVKAATDELRAVITDFGLARTAAASGKRDDTATLAGDVVGSPAYMSPEQVEGHELSPKSDLYSLGVVMYQMLTGVLPFVADTPLAMAVKRLKGPPSAPSTLVPDLPSLWDRLIMACLSREPGDRIQSAAAVVAALEGGEALRHPTHRREQEEPRPITPSRRSVAVLGFKNLTRRPDTEWISTALTEMMRTELSVGEDLRTVPGESVARGCLGLGIEQTDSFAADTLRRLRANLGTDFVVTGSYLALGSEGKLRLDLRLQDATTGEMALALSDSGREEDLLDLVARVGARLRARLGASAVGSGELGGVRASLPRNPEATRLYAEGLQKLRELDALHARDLLERAVRADPDFPLAHTALAEAWSRLGNEARAREEAKHAFDLSADLPREERLLVEGRHRTTTGAWPQAIEIFRALFALFPEDLDRGVALLDALLLAGQWREALSLVAALRRLPPPAGENPRIDLGEARAYGGLADYEQSRVAGRLAAAKSKAEGSRLLAAQALCVESWALRFLGSLSEAADLAREAEGIFAEAGDRAGVADALTIGSGMLFEQGRFREVVQMRERALAIFRDIGKRQGEAAVQSNIGWALYNLGDVARARALGQVALDIQDELGDRHAAAWSRLLIGACLLEEGDVQGSRASHEQALSVLREIDDGRGVAWSLHRIADVDLACGALGAARSGYERALAIRDQRSYRVASAAGRVALARVALAEGNGAEAELLATQALHRYRADEAPEGRALAEAALALALTVQGRRDEAQGHAQAARTLSVTCEVPRVRALLDQLCGALARPSPRRAS